MYYISKISKHLFTLCLSLFVSLSTSAFVVVLDAGHGGKDPGALGTYSKEKNINLNVVLKLGKLIEQNCRGVKVIYTRKTDKFIELYERAEIANNAKADLFISVHTNSTASGNTARGSETYSLSLERATANLEVVKRENSVIQYETNRQRYAAMSVENTIMNEIIQSNNMRASALFAKSIQDEYVSVGRPNKGVHQAGFLVLRKTAMPSVLTELGFINTPSEEAYLNSEQGINELATSIYNAFRKYISPILRGVEAPAVQPEPDEKPAFEAPADVSDDEEVKPVPKQQTQQQTSIQTKPAQKPQTTSQAQTEQPTPTKKPTSTDGKYEFKVQICASSRNLRPDSEQFKGLKGIQSHPITINGRQQYIHTYGSTTSYAAIKDVQAKIKDKFADCFIVVFKDGQRIIGEEANLAKKKQP
ncbi:MAG: N-acetylmuramoyl-L-alanine amidase [Bacteroidaceae bacterium]|nr:N-acetylmuramoyl-L-alanine amidase [Bacteroidaceae bacterium]